MAEYTNLNSLFADVASAIRDKTGSDELIKAEAFPEAIEGIPTPTQQDNKDIVTLINRTIESYDDSEEKVSYIGGSAFYSCAYLSQINFPVCEEVGPYAFCECESLEEAVFPQCTSLNYNAFAHCLDLSYADFPEISCVDDCAFYQCTSLEQANVPKAEVIGLYAFDECSSLTSINLPECTEIGSSAFRRCMSLSAMYLPGDTIPSLGSYALAYTPMAVASYLGYFGSIYVPESMVSDYQTHAGWSGYSSRITAIVE